jgi:diketogulonate reductase-like aldo/keto reductase
VFTETKVWISDYGYDQTLHAFDKSAAKLGGTPSTCSSSTRPCRPRSTRPSRRTAGTGSVFDDPAITKIAEAHGKSPAQVMLRWHLQAGRSAIPKSVKAQRIAENFDVFDFTLAPDQTAAIDALDTGVRGGPEPEAVTLEAFGRDIPEV